MKKHFFGVISLKLDNNDFERANIKTKKRKGKDGFLQEFCDTLEVFYMNKDLDFAKLEENPFTYSGDFAEEINDAIQHIRQKMLKVNEKYTKIIELREQFFASAKIPVKELEEFEKEMKK